MTSAQKPDDHPSMSKTTWGRAGWMYLHAVAWNFPLNPTRADRANALAYVRALMRTVPCPECARDFRALVLPDLYGNVDSPIFASRAAFARATNRWHNAVNAKLGKDQVPFERVRAWFGDVALDDDDAVDATSDAQYDARAVRHAQRRACVVGALLVALIVAALGRQILYPGPSVHATHPRTHSKHKCRVQTSHPFH